jgi:bacteriorhodopsin
VQYVRYIDWTITTPLLLLELLLNTGLPLSDIIAVIFMDLVMIITGLVGALVASRYKWGYYAFGCAALLYIWFVLFVKGRASALALGADVQRAYTRSSMFSFCAFVIPLANPALQPRSSCSSGSSTRSPGASPTAATSSRRSRR